MSETVDKIHLKASSGNHIFDTMHKGEDEQKTLL